MLADVEPLLDGIELQDGIAILAGNFPKIRHQRIQGCRSSAQRREVGEIRKVFALL